MLPGDIMGHEMMGEVVEVGLQAWRAVTLCRHPSWAACARPTKGDGASLRRLMAARAKIAVRASAARLTGTRPTP